MTAIWHPGLIAATGRMAGAKTHLKKISSHCRTPASPAAAGNARGFGSASAHPGPQGAADDATDEALMGRVAQGDRQALRLLYGRHQLKVFRFALRLTGNSATAEDVTSEVFIELWR